MFLLAFFLFFASISFSQDTLSKNTHVFAFTIYPGYIPKTYPTVPSSRYAFLSSVNWSRSFNGKDKWHQLYHFPSAGLEFFFGTYNNASELGYNLGCVPSFEFKDKKEHTRWSVKVGLGVAYFNKPYSAASNPKNYYIGSHFTNMSTASFIWERVLSKNTFLSYGLSLMHCSNGHIKLPNVGMNLFLLNVGLKIKEPAIKHKQLLPEKNKRYSVAVKFSVGYHQFGETGFPVGGPVYPSYHLSAWMSKPLVHAHLIQAGFVVGYYTSFYDFQKTQQWHKKYPRLYSSTALLIAGHEFVFGKFSLSTQLGIYFYNSFFIQHVKNTGNWNSFGQKLEAINSNRLGILYYPFKPKNTLNCLNKQLMLGAFIKANLAQADLIEWCVGYVF